MLVIKECVWDVQVVSMLPAHMHGGAFVHMCEGMCGIQADSTPPAMTDGGMVYSSEKCLNHTAESTTSVTDFMW